VDVQPIEDSAEVRDAVGRALRQVATAEATRPLEREQHAYVAAIGAYLLGDELDVVNARPLAPDELAAALPSPAIREPVVDLLTVVPYADATLSPAKVALVGRFADALGIGEAGLRRRRDVVHPLALAARAHYAREHRYDWSAQDRIQPVRARLREWERGDPRLAARFHALDELHPDTLGRAYADFCRNRQYPLPGEPGAPPESLGLARHDLAHVLTGCSTTSEGEVLLSALLAGNARGDGLLVAAVGLLAAPEVPPAGTRLPSHADYWAAVARGAAMTAPVMSPAWDPWAHVGRPLDAVRAELGIGPAPDVVAAAPRPLVRAS
jgi:hypothetical protein